MIVYTCVHCKGQFPADQMQKNRSKKDGVGSFCKECNRKKANEYYHAHREECLRKQKEHDKQRSAEQKEAKRIRIRKYNRLHKDAVNARARKRYRSQREIELANRPPAEIKPPIVSRVCRVCGKDTPLDKLRVDIHCLGGHDRICIECSNKQMSEYGARNRRKMYIRSDRRRAKQLGANGSYTEQELIAVYNRQGGKCFYCGEPLPENYHADHVVPLSRGGSNYIENIVCACPYCNRSKGSRLVYEWLRDKALARKKGG